jgi:hypothetical protein
MSDATQRTVFGDEIEDVVSFTTTGRVIRPFKRMIDKVASEYRLQCDSDGIHVAVVDSTNVLAGEFTLFASALEEYSGAATIGVNADQFGSTLQHARYGKTTDDKIAVSADAMDIQTTVQRPFGETDATLSERASLIDPDSIRQQPEIPTPDDLELEIIAELAPQTVIEAMKAIDDSEHVKLGTEQESIHIRQDLDVQQRNIELSHPVGVASDFTFYSADYVTKIVRGLANGYVDTVTLKWDEDMPLYAEFEREGVYSGQYMLAPRVKPD